MHNLALYPQPLQMLHVYFPGAVFGCCCQSDIYITVPQLFAVYKLHFEFFTENLNFSTSLRYSLRNVRYFLAYIFISLLNFYLICKIVNT